jgi:hypothetical protein
MNGIEKVLIALEDPAPSARDDFDAWTRRLAAIDGIDRAEVEALAEDAQRAHTQKPPRFYAFASLWLPAAAVEEVLATAPGTTQWFRVRERLAFDRSARPDEVRPWAGVKKTTPWTPVDGVDTRIWQGRYTNHGHIAKAYHATCVRYRQNVVLDGSDPALRAVSELWWTNVEDLLERFYLSEEAERLLAVDTSGFVDAARAHPTVTTHETLRTGCTVTGERGFL